MTALVGRQFRLAENAYMTKLRAGKRILDIKPCPVCGFPMRMANAMGVLPPGCSTVCMDEMLRRRRAEERGKAAAKFLAWKASRENTPAP